MPQLPLSIYLEILSSATATDGPFTKYEGAEKVSEAFAKIATGLAEFVTAAKDVPEIGYEAARTTMEDMVHLLPMVDVDPLQALMERLAAQPASPEAMKPEEADAIADAFAKMLDGLPTAEDPNDTKEN